MTYAADIATLRAPVLDNASDFATVLWESEGSNVKRLLTGKQSSPGEYMLHRVEYASGEWGSSGGNNQVRKHADIDCRLCVEKVAGARATAIIAARADSLVTRYSAANDGQVTFHTPEAYLTGEYEYADAWIARDWVCPVEIWAAA